MAERVRAGELMQPAEPVRGGDTLEEAADAMRRQDMDVLPVVEDRGLVGLLLHRDMTVDVTDSRTGSSGGWVREAMAGSPLVCSEEEDVADVAARMRRRGSPYAVVVDSLRRPRGVLYLEQIRVAAAA